MIITLCGSARFEPFFHVWKKALELAGHAVLTLDVFPSEKGGVKDWYTEEEKRELDALHLHKINKSDAIFVLNLFAYIGSSTQGEILYAKFQGKKIYFLESWKKGLGVDFRNTKSCRDWCFSFLRVRTTRSPIDTYHPFGLCPWSGDLLGPAGYIRHQIVDITRDEALYE